VSQSAFDGCGAQPVDLLDTGRTNSHLSRASFAFKANLIGEGGIDFLLQRENGNELIRDRGSCHFA
jgi:hypothetical protein